MQKFNFGKYKMNWLKSSIENKRLRAVPFKRFDNRIMISMITNTLNFIYVEYLDGDMSLQASFENNKHAVTIIRFSGLNPLFLEKFSAAFDNHGGTVSCNMVVDNDKIMAFMKFIREERDGARKQ